MDFLGVILCVKIREQPASFSHPHYRQVVIPSFPPQLSSRSVAQFFAPAFILFFEVPLGPLSLEKVVLDRLAELLPF